MVDRERGEWETFWLGVQSVCGRVEKALLPRTSLAASMAQRRDKGRRGRYGKGRPQGRHPRFDERRPKKHPHKRPDREPAKREMLAKGKASEVGLDGRLRIEMEPVHLELAARLSRGKGALVFTPRGDRLGAVETVIGTLDRPIAVVKVFPEMRKEASQVQGRELFLG